MGNPFIGKVTIRPQVLPWRGGRSRLPRS